MMDNLNQESKRLIEFLMEKRELLNKVLSINNEQYEMLAKKNIEFLEETIVKKDRIMEKLKEIDFEVQIIQNQISLMKQVKSFSLELLPPLQAAQYEKLRRDTDEIIHNILQLDENGIGKLSTMVDELRKEMHSVQGKKRLNQYRGYTGYGQIMGPNFFDKKK